MATNLENLTTAKASLIAQIAAQEALGFQPDYSVGGQSVQTQSALTNLYERLEKINNLINQEDPYELRSEFNT